MGSPSPGLGPGGGRLPTTDPRQAVDGLILPMAGHKGYGIAFMMDVLSGVLTGSSYATGVTGPYVPDRRSGCGHLLLALRVDAVAEPGDYARRLDDLIDRTKAVPLAPGFDEIFYPGEIEDRNAARTGVGLPGRTLRGLARLADECAIDRPAWMEAA
ncbi:Ldh family oxidoreductase [Nonomuraea thailandensis]